MLGQLRALAAALLVAAGLPAAASAYEARVIALRARDLVFDPVSGKLYASVPSVVGADGNSLRAIDPVTGAVGPVVPVGSEPNRLAVSDDGSTLYVGLDGGGSVRRVALPGLVPGIEFELMDPGDFRPLRAIDLAVQPGNADVLAVTRAHLDGFGTMRLAIYDDGVIQPDTVGIFESGPASIEFSEDPDVLYALFKGFARLGVDENGVHEISNRFYLDDFPRIERFGSRIYSPAGDAYDPATDLRLGRYAAIASDVLADPAAGRVYFLYPGLVVVFDLERFVPLDVIEVSEMLGFPANLVQWGPNGLAFTTDAGQVILFDPTPPDADGDGVPDPLDNCPADANAGQADSDEDGPGDACDPHPGESESELAQCEADQADVAAERLVCEAEPRFVDADADGVHDGTDPCAATPFAAAVDGAGCSQAQFCVAQADACERADWRNDEPRGKPHDCVRVGSKQTGYQCVAG